MLDKVRRAMDLHDMTRPGDRVLVAVSGGPDSLALLHVLNDLSPERGLALHVYTLDHGLRGDESAGDAAFVAEAAASLGLPCTAERVDVGAEGFRRGLSLQAAARALRYERLAAVATRIGARRIATGHNREDQAETVLLRLLRGAGLRGLAGIPPVRDGIYIRPLLAVSRAEIEEYLARHGLEPRRDPTNARAVYLRNRIRLELVPQLQRDYNPRLVDTLAAMAERLRHDAEFIELAAAAAWSDVTEASGAAGEVALNVAALLAQPPALVGPILQRAVAPAFRGTGRELSSTAVAAIVALAQRGHNGELDLGADVVAGISYGRLVFRRHRGPAAPYDPVPLPVPGDVIVETAGARITATLCRPGETPAPGAEEPGCAIFAWDRLPGPLAIRSRRPGDRLSPVGMTGTQKLQDLFVNSKVPRHQRDLVPLLVAGEDILWVMGFRLDRRWAVAPERAARCNFPTLWVRFAPVL